MSKIITKPRVIITAAACLVVATAFGAGFALAAQPHMQSALAFLQSAHTQLDIAEPDKGGHRVKAKAFVEDAIAEVNLGILAGS